MNNHLKSKVRYKPHTQINYRYYIQNIELKGIVKELFIVLSWGRLLLNDKKLKNT